MTTKNKLHTKCIMCGKKLKSYQSQLRGYGPTCYIRYRQQRIRRIRLF